MTVGRRGVKGESGRSEEVGRRESGRSEEEVKGESGRKWRVGGVRRK